MKQHQANFKKSSSVKTNLIKIILAIVLIIFILLSTTSCTAFDPKNLFESLNPNFNVFIVHITASLIIIMLAIWLVWKPTKHMIDARRELASKNINDAERAKKEAYERLMEAEEKRLAAYVKAEEIIAKYNEKGHTEFDAIIDDAKKTADQIINKAKNDVKTIETQLKIDANRRIVNISLLTTKSILKKEINEKDNEKFINEFIKKLESRKGALE